MRVAVLGCGPAGLLVAHAATLCGHTANIFSKRQKSPMEGAQYMHVEIPDIDMPPPQTIHYALWGDVETYRQKVYGSGDPDITVSPEQYLGSHKCWDIRHMYDVLWETWARRVADVKITPHNLEHIVQMHDWVFSTIPAPVLCHEEHEFPHQPVWIDNLWSGPDAHEWPELWESEHVVLCNGQPLDENNPELTGWYRTSHIYGHTNTEWSAAGAVPANRTQHAGQIWRVRKPLHTNCNCWPMVVRVGRYGLWQKGVLTHHAFEQAIRHLS